jgi:hypothetical protein
MSPLLFILIFGSYGVFLVIVVVAVVAVVAVILATSVVLAEYLQSLRSLGIIVFDKLAVV